MIGVATVVLELVEELVCGRNAKKRVRPSRQFFESRHRWTVPRHLCEKLAIHLEGPLGLPGLVAHQLGRLESKRHALVRILGVRGSDLGDLEELMPALGLTIEARQRAQGRFIRTKSRNDVAIGGDRTLDVSQLLFEDLTDAPVEYQLLLLVTRQLRTPLDDFDQRLPTPKLLVEPLEGRQRIGIGRIELQALLVNFDGTLGIVQGGFEQIREPRQELIAPRLVVLELNLTA